jgi:acyl-CoA thioesterase I
MSALGSRRRGARDCVALFMDRGYTGEMRQLLVLLLLMSPGFVAGPARAAAAADCPRARVVLPPLPRLQAELQSGGTLVIVALGSSSTEGAGASGPHAVYPARLEAALRRALPGAALRVVNAGRSGETSEEMLARLDADVLVHEPDLVIWQASGNEVLRGRAPERFLEVMRAGIARLRDAGAGVLLMDNQRAPRIEGAPLSARFDRAMEELASIERVPLFARSRLMRAWRDAGVPPSAVLAPDELHHNDRGYACLAEALATALLDAALPEPNRQFAAR